MLVEWSAPSPMRPDDPAPAVLCIEGTLWVAYRIARDAHDCGAVRFLDVHHYAWGLPPAVHLEPGEPAPRQGGFYEVPPASGGGDPPPGARRWLVTFPAAVLDVTASAAEVVLRATAAPSPAHVLAALLA